MDGLLTYLCVGVSWSAVYFHLAMGVTLIFGMLRIVHFCHGDVCLAAAMGGEGYLGGAFKDAFAYAVAAAILVLAPLYRRARARRAARATLRHAEGAP